MVVLLFILCDMQQHKAPIDGRDQLKRKRVHDGSDEV
jgi:hypothetical protein